MIEIQFRELGEGIYFCGYGTGDGVVVEVEYFEVGEETVFGWDGAGCGSSFID